MRSITHFLKHPKDILIGFLRRTAAYWPDKMYLRIVYYLYMGKILHLNNPITLTEKLNWLKINDIHPEYSKLVDKYEVKFHVAKILGTEENIIKTIGVWDSFDKIDFSSLPDKFVLKTTNGGGNSSVVICTDKSKLDIEETRKRLRLADGKTLFMWSREYPYYDVPPRIIAEEFVETPNNELSDYKIFCFDGNPRFLFIGTERQKEGVDVKFDFYDLNFNHLPIKNGHENSVDKMSRPKNFDKMLEIATRLSKGFPHVRVDLYNVDGKIYFGELTFFHFGVFTPFDPEEWDKKFGDMLDISHLKK